MTDELTAETILNIDDSILERLTIPEWGGEIYIRTMTGAERDRWDLFSEKEVKKTGHVNIRARLAVMVACNSKGERIFKDEDAKELSKKSAKALDRIFDAASKINRLNDESIGEAEKN